MNKVILLILLALALVPAANAQLGNEVPAHILVNSQGWTDVYSAMLYGSLNQQDTQFLVSDRHSGIILTGINKPAHLWIINSRTPFVTGFGNYAESQGFSVEEFNMNNVNLELARQFDTTKFVIIDDSYGYNAVSVAPYAVASRSFVLFADRNNIGDVADFLSERGVTALIIYGHVDREVTNALAQYNPEVINKDGDRFANNIEIVKKYQAITHSRQAILTNGEFIESGIMAGKEPVVFIGSNNVPDVTRNYISNSEITVGVLIGNELVNTATFIRRQIGISVFVKFARSARAPSTSISQVEALDMFYLPRYQLNLAIEGVTYNQATHQLEVTFGNRADQAIYLKGSYTVKDSDGSLQTVGDTDAVFIEGNEVKTFVYNIRPISAESASVDAFIIYGESKNSLERTIEATYCLSCSNKLGIVDILDNCDLNVSAVTYATSREFFRVDVQNPSQVACYVDVQLNDVVIAAERVTVALKDTALLEPGAGRSLRIKAVLDSDDIADNPFVNVKAFYGQRENALVKMKDGRFPLLIDSAVFGGLGIVSLSLMGVILLIVASIVWKVYGRRRKPF